MTCFIDNLDKLIADRKAHPQPQSYTNRLLANREKVAQKVGEEATEVIIAALAQNEDRLVDESADLIYHLLVLLHTRDLTWHDVVTKLEARHGHAGQGGSNP